MGTSNLQWGKCWEDEKYYDCRWAELSCKRELLLSANSSLLDSMFPVCNALKYNKQDQIPGTTPSFVSMLGHCYMLNWTNLDFFTANFPVLAWPLGERHRSKEFRTYAFHWRDSDMVLRIRTNLLSFPWLHHWHSRQRFLWSSPQSKSWRVWKSLRPK